jgi:hypothetical protein
VLSGSIYVEFDFECLGPPALGFKLAFSWQLIINDIYSPDRSFTAKVFNNLIETRE